MARVILFMPRFHAAILSGAKRQTIRRPRKRPIQPGEPLSLRAWEGKPYRSPQRPLLDVVCSAVLPIAIQGGDALAIRLGSKWLSSRSVKDFARADGFADAADMAAFWRDVHELERDVFGPRTFEGEVIYWEAES